jgi:hypothetical protein
MTDTYDPDAILADPLALPTHKMYAAINIGIRDRGERWSKCANCGQPYQLIDHPTENWGEPWIDTTVCSPTCFDEYLTYVNNPEW